MKETSEWILKAMRIFAWIIFVWMLVKAGAMIMAYGASVENPEGAKDLYGGLDLSRYYQASFIHYTIIVFYYFLQYLLLAYIALFATRLLSEETLENVYSATVANILQKISVTILSVFVICILHNIHTFILEKYAEIQAEAFSGESIFMAGMIYVLSVVFLKSIDGKLKAD
ncbi:MAG: hypothetical protein AAF611_21795 [Bacteroidota bacterium]